jgi:hypothetical protein
MSIPFLVPMPRPAVLDAPGRFSADPVGVYINRLGVGSRRGQIGALDTCPTRNTSSFMML